MVSGAGRSGKTGTWPKLLPSAGYKAVPQAGSSARCAAGTEASAIERRWPADDAWCKADSAPVDDLAAASSGGSSASAAEDGAAPMRHVTQNVPACKVPCGDVPICGSEVVSMRIVRELRSLGQEGAQRVASSSSRRELSETSHSGPVTSHHLRKQMSTWTKPASTPPATRGTCVLCVRASR